MSGWQRALWARFANTQRYNGTICFAVGDCFWFGRLGQGCAVSERWFAGYKE